MKHISILIPKRARLSSIEIPRQAFSEVNEILISMGKEALFTVQMIGQTPEVKLTSGLYTVSPDILLKDLKKTDLVIVPAMEGNLKEAIAENLSFIPWIIEQYKSGAEVASLCVGAFLLAATGLLRGKQCSTHWRAANDFKKSFPEVNLVVDKIMTDDHGIYSSGGAFSSSNLILYLIEKYAGRAVAVRCSKLFQIEIERGSQSPFIIFSGQKDHADDVIKNVQEFIEQNFSDRITVDQLSDKFGISRRTFERRFKAATFNSVVEYTQRVKIEAAKKQLEFGRKTVNEIMYEVGYTDIKAFRTVFNKITGMSPIEYRNRYNTVTAF